MIIAGTGHRPNKLGGYGYLASVKREQLARNWLSTYVPTLVISGMALGWDQALAQAATQEGISFDAYIPFKGQERMWPKESQNIYSNLLCHARKIIYVCDPGYAPWKMQKRNETMIDACDQVLALFDGSKGGTWNCIQYAESKGKIINNCWSDWEKLK